MTRRDGVWIAGLSAAIEILTCVMRFGFGLQSSHDTPWIADLTFGIRIHHGYIGLVMLACVPLLPVTWRPWPARIGAALLISDLVHHFAVLWPIVGDPQFDLRYPGR